MGTSLMQRSSYTFITSPKCKGWYIMCPLVYWIWFIWGKEKKQHLTILKSLFNYSFTTSLLSHRVLPYLARGRERLQAKHSNAETKSNCWSTHQDGGVILASRFSTLIKHLESQVARHQSRGERSASAALQGRSSNISELPSSTSFISTNNLTS